MAVTTWGWSSYFEEVASFVNTLDRQLGIANQQFCDYAIERLAVCIANLSTLIGVVSGSTSDGDQVLEPYELTLQELMDTLTLIRRRWIDYSEQTEALTYTTRYSAPTHRTNQTGRPRFVISRDQLQYLRSLSFSWPEISSLLGVSRMTVYRRRQEYGMLYDDHATTLSDQELDTLLRGLRTDLPFLGESLVMGRIRSLGLSVPRQQLREAIRRTDPLNTPLRWGGSIPLRRPYSVPGPNSLWHIDGHHKLIRWRMVTHAGIDGYSRMITYMKCSSDNRANTVYEKFLKGVELCGLPSRVRSDFGSENVLVARHMLRYRGLNRNSMITGSSTHNQRIERMWVDMHRCVTRLYYRLFYFLEHQCLLDHLNEEHLYALAYVYLPRINRSLEVFCEGWNNHGIRTMHHLSPRQLFVSGTLQLRNSGLAAVDFFDNIEPDYGIDYDESEAHVDIDSTSDVVIPRSRIQLSHEDQELLHLVDPLATSTNHGIELYEEVVRILHEIHTSSSNST